MRPGTPTNPASDDTATTWPLLARSSGSAAWVHHSVPQKLTAITSSYHPRSSAATSPNNAWADTPALLTSTSMRPKASAVTVASAWQAVRSRTSVATVRTRVPWLRQAVATSSSAVWLRAANTSASPAPSRMAH